MKSYIKELIVVTIFVVIAILKRISVPFFGMVALIALFFVYFFIIYSKIKSNDFKSHVLLPIIECFYKIFYITALYFYAGNFPGKDYLAGASIALSLLYIIFVLFKMKNNYDGKIICAIIYIVLFNTMFIAMR